MLILFVTQKCVVLLFRKGKQRNVSDVNQLRFSAKKQNQIKNVPAPVLLTNSLIRRCTDRSLAIDKSSLYKIIASKDVF